MSQRGASSCSKIVHLPSGAIRIDFFPQVYFVVCNIVFMASEKERDHFCACKSYHVWIITFALIFILSTNVKSKCIYN